MKIHTILLFSAVLLAAAPAANAGDRSPFGNGELPEFLQAFDVDGDRRLSEEERQAYLQAIRDGQVPRPDRPDRPPGNPWDTDGDGVLSDAERTAAQEVIRARILEQRTRRFNELDTGDDGFLTLEELEGIPRIREGHAARILAHLDKDPDGPDGLLTADGKISLEEFLHALRPPRPGGGGPRPGEGDGGGR